MPSSRRAARLILLMAVLEREIKIWERHGSLFSKERARRLSNILAKQLSNIGTALSDPSS